jgi:hypothetical protein
MTKLYNVKCKKKRWPVQEFFNILNMAGINSWILFKSIDKSNISRRNFSKELSNELYQLVNESKNEPTQSTPTTPSSIRKRVSGPRKSTTPPV